MTSSYRNKMSLLTYYKSTHDEIQELIRKHVQDCRRSAPWDGEHEVVVQKIINIFKRTH